MYSGLMGLAGLGRGAIVEGEEAVAAESGADSVEAATGRVITVY